MSAVPPNPLPPCGPEVLEPTDAVGCIFAFDAYISDPCVFDASCSIPLPTVGPQVGPPPTLPLTGAPNAGVATAGGLLVLVGACACLIARRRRDV